MNNSRANQPSVASLPNVPPMIDVSSASNESLDVYHLAQGQEVIYHTPQRNKKKRSLFRSKRADREQESSPGGVGADVVMVAACKIITKTPIKFQLDTPHLKEIADSGIQAGKGFQDWSIIFVSAVGFWVVVSTRESINDIDLLSIMFLFAILIAFLTLMKINNFVNKYLEEKKLV